MDSWVGMKCHALSRAVPILHANNEAHSEGYHDEEGQLHTYLLTHKL